VVDLPIKLVIFDDLSISFHHETCPNGHQPVGVARKASRSSAKPVTCHHSTEPSKNNGVIKLYYGLSSSWWFQPL
jgi:membrane-anchored protein YejM (alkaline phosphatase superfamily)